MSNTLKTARTYRLSPAAIIAISAIADRDGVSATEAVERAVAAFAEPAREPEPDAATAAAVDALAAQLSAKDEQIAALTSALGAAQDTTKAAQALQAAAMQRLPEPKAEKGGKGKKRKRKRKS